MAMDIKLRRGVTIRGKVTEQRTARPIARATVQYLPARGPNDVTSRLHGRRGQQGRRLVPDRRPPRQGAPVRLRPDFRLCPRSDRRTDDPLQPTRRPALLCCTTSSPTTSRPATRRTSSSPRCGRARPSRAAWSGRMVRRSKTPRSSPFSTSTTSTSTGAATSPATPATAPSSCTGSTRRRPRACLSSTPSTSGARPSSFPASRPARS